MKKILVTIALMGVVCGSGCVSTKQFVPMPDQDAAVQDSSKARIYVLRPGAMASGIAMRVNDGETVIGKTGPNGYLCWEREPGEAEIRSKAENTSVVKLTVEQNQVYYIRQQPYPGFFIARNKIFCIDADKGKELLAKCKAPSVEIP